ncbi:TPA: hypothetical protein DCW38_04015 [candidate division WOR-3 bacterium]|jgi:hypothetical protein|uniref:Uncharacterized protein n=1 Tax=candidate division WOR-3 bacterium TaxID=2052148 RepID=A0A350H9W1_UNCW3|nr:hypothetical protein [candidate division WOR-3 bacterium]
MHKAIAVLILLLSLNLIGDSIFEPKIPDISELPKPTEIYYPEYSFIEIGATTNRDLSLYSSFLDGLSYLKSIVLFGFEERRFIEADYTRHEFKGLNGRISYSLNLLHASDSSSGSHIIPKFNYLSNIGMAVFKASVSSVYFPEKFLFNNMSEFSYENHSEDFDWGIISKWQRTDKPLSSHIGFFIEKENIRYGLFYSRNIFPFLHIRPAEKSDFGFELLVDAERTLLLKDEALFSSMQTIAENQRISTRYFGSLSVKYFSLKAEAEVYSNIDSAEAYGDMSSLYYGLNVSYSGMIKRLAYDIAVKMSKNEISKYSFMRFFAFYENRELRLMASYKMYGLEEGLSHIISPSVSLGDNSKRITFGVRNILSQFDAEEDLYAPERTYFINIVFIRASLFGKPKR